MSSMLLLVLLALKFALGVTNEREKDKIPTPKYMGFE